MEISKSRNLLLSLSQTIAFHRLPNLELVAVVSKSKCANAYAWDDRRGILCFGRQKRVGIFRLEGGREFVEVKEFTHAHTQTSLKYQYGIYNRGALE